jgi:adenosylcobinamide-phosphate synthase
VKDELAFCVLGAIALDLVLGDPRWFPHPVRLMGWSARGLEWLLVRLLGRNRPAGMLFTLLIVGGSYASVRALLWAAERWDHRAALGLTTALLYTCFAARDLDVESTRVYRDLERGDLEASRRSLSMIVGRETSRLDEAEVTRAAVETVAENTVDGVISPLFFAILGGAPLAMAFKAASTLDSMVGHRTPRYLKFGWASARLDDLLNFIPARLARLFYPLSSLICGLSATNCWRIAWRDGQKSPSPNAGISEAAVAGALGVRLGGINFYEGMELCRPHLGDPLRPLDRRDIRRAVHLMYATEILMLAFLLGIRILFVTTQPWKHWS